MTELERALETIGSELDFPARRISAAHVRARIERRSQWRRAVLVFAARRSCSLRSGSRWRCPTRAARSCASSTSARSPSSRSRRCRRPRERPLVAGLGSPRSRATPRSMRTCRSCCRRGPPPQRFYAHPGFIAVLLSVEGSRYCSPSSAATRSAPSRSSPRARDEGRARRRRRVRPLAGRRRSRAHVAIRLADTRQIRTRLAGNVLSGWRAAARSARGRSDQGEDARRSPAISPV